MNMNFAALLLSMGYIPWKSDCGRIETFQSPNWPQLGSWRIEIVDNEVVSLWDRRDPFLGDYTDICSLKDAILNFNYMHGTSTDEEMKLIHRRNSEYLATRPSVRK